MNINKIIKSEMVYIFYKYYKYIDININWFILLKIKNSYSKLIISNTIYFKLI